MLVTCLGLLGFFRSPGWGGEGGKKTLERRGERSRQQFFGEKKKKEKIFKA